MAVSKAITQLTWAGDTNYTMAGDAPIDSDYFTYDAEDWDAVVSLEARNLSTPAGGDLTWIWVRYSPDASELFEDTEEHGHYLGEIECAYETPSTCVFPLLTAPRGFRIVSRSPNSGTHNISISGYVCTYRIA